MSTKYPTTFWSPFHQYTETFLNNPWTNWHRFFNPMTAFERTINTQFFPQHYTINWKNAEDVGVEAHVIEEVGSYGKQLSVILDVLDVLVAQVETNDLTRQEQRNLNRFHTLVRQVDATIAQYEGKEKESTTVRDVTGLINALQTMYDDDPETHAILLRRLHAAITEFPQETERNGVMTRKS